MSEENNDATSVVRIDDKDWFLQRLVNIVNSGGVNFGITLNVSGFLVSGNLIGGKEYFEGCSADFASGLASGESAGIVKKTIAEFIASGGDIYTSDEDEKRQISPSYVHLRNAKFYNTNGNPIPSNRGVLWRGRISEVSGFALGSLSAEMS